MSTQKTFSIVLLLLLALVLMSSVYTVREGQGALVFRLGKLTTDSAGKPITKKPGLQFKVPIINQVRYFDMRLQTHDIKSSAIMTKNKKEVIVDYYVKWRINNLPRFYTATAGDPAEAERLLEKNLNGSLRDQFGKRTIPEVVAGERSDIMTILLQQADVNAENMGVDVVDVRIKRIDLPVTVSTSVYDRMKAEREKVANEHRAEGRAIAESIKANADREVIEIIAKAESDALTVRGEGDAAATRIYADAFSKDADFYGFLRSLEAYQQSFASKKDFILLKPDGEFFKYFTTSANK